MDASQFEAMVARLEVQSARSPAGYQGRVALLALLGFAILALVVGVASAGLLLLIGVVVALVLTGGKALFLIVQIGKLLILLAWPLWLLVKSSLRALFSRLPAPVGIELERAQAPALHAAIATMRRRMRGPRVHHVLIVDDLNAAVVQRPLFGLFGFPRNYLLLGLPLLESLAADEALAVVAHEYGHLAGSHGRFAAFIYRLRHTWGTIESLSAQWQGWGGRLLRRLIGWYAPYFNAYTYVLARANEYQADAASAELVGAPVAATALLRVNLATAQYQRFMDQTLRGLRDEATPPPNLAARWAGRALETAPPEDAQRWLQGALARRPSPADTHPALADRLQALRQSAATAALPPPTPASAAEVWLGHALGPLRERLGREWHDRVAPSWAERHQELQAQLRRLADLRLIADPSTAERIETLQLQGRLYPDEDLRPALAAFNAGHPDHALGLFLEGSARIRHDDEAGLALLDRAMALDNDAVKPACERAWTWLEPRQDPRAPTYRERWMRRHEWEQQREAQYRRLDPAHALAPAELPPEVRAKVLANLRHAGRGIARAWLVRRVLPADPLVRTYVLGIEPTLANRLWRRGPRLVHALAALEWPFHLFITTCEGAARPLRAKMRAVPGAEVALNG